MSVRIVLVSLTGILEYRFVISRDASVKCVDIGLTCSFWSKSVVFFTLKVFGRGAMLFIFCVNSLERWYAGVLRQFTTGLMGCPGLCNFMSPLMEGAEGLRFVYFHLLSFGISVLLCFMVFLMSAWKELVGSLVMVVNVLLCRKSCILEWYCCVGSMTMELPLSALAVMALFLFSLDLMECISLASGCV